MTRPEAGKTLLVIDDDRLLCDIIRTSLVRDGIQVQIAHTGKEGVRLCRGQRVDIVLLDQKLPDGRGRDFFQDILDQNEQTKIIFITAYPSFESAVKGIKLGAFDYLSKPFDIGELRLAVHQAARTMDLERIAQVQRYKDQKEIGETDLVGSRGGLKAVAKLVGLAATSDAPVIITGETGTGKNVVARSIHYARPDSNAPLLSINCAAFPENLIESELFGYEKGAFTGADAPKKGIFEMADGGTLILDEIGEVPLHLQVKLLGTLEDGRVMRLGGSVVRPVRVRVVAVTNVDLEQAVRTGKFRSDLYFRLNVIRIHIPPLRERVRDIPALCTYFLRKATNGRVKELPAPVMERLSEYHWPGNVRELKNVIERAAVLQREAMLHRPESLDLFVDSLPTPIGSSSQETSFAPVPLKEVEKQHILRTLERFSGNLARTSRALGISLSTLKRRLKEYRQSAA